MTPRLTACLLFVRGGPAWQIMFALVQATVAQAGSTALAAQAQPQPVTPWQPVAGTPSGNLSMQASIPTPATNAAYKESWYNSPGRWCKPSNQDPVTGPGQHCSLHPMPCSCPNRLTVSMMEIALLGLQRHAQHGQHGGASAEELESYCIPTVKQGQGNNCHSQGQQAKATLHGTGATSYGMSCLAWTSQAAACASWHVGPLSCILGAGFLVPSTQFSSYGSANHPGETQSSWAPCFQCSNALNQCTAVAGSPNTTDQFSLFRGALAASLRPS